MVVRTDTARIIIPTRRTVDIPAGNGYVRMVDGDLFDEWPRTRVAARGRLSRDREVAEDRPPS